MTNYKEQPAPVAKPHEQEPEQQEPDWKYRLIAQHEETILWQAKRIAELLDAPQPPAQPIIKSYLEKDNSAPAQQEPSIRFNTQEALDKAKADRGKPVTPVEYKPVISNAGAECNIEIEARFFPPKGAGKVKFHELTQRKWVVPDLLTAHDPETPEYRNGWNDCRQLMMEMYRKESK